MAQTNMAEIQSPETFRRFLMNKAVTPHFQPIIDLYLGELLSYEVLSRGRTPFQSPIAMFERAEEWGLLWELEQVCHQAALEAISNYLHTEPRMRFFLNVTPQVFTDDRFIDVFEQMCCTRHGIDPRLIVLEITEANSVDNFKHLEEQTTRCTEHGFHIALDDFGAGHSSLVTLVAASPQYLKLDRAIVQGIDQDPYKQHLVKSIVLFAASVESKLIAEGVETVEELEVLLRLGVRYAQGFLLGYPQPEPEPIREEVATLIRDLTRRFHYPRICHKNRILSMVMRPPVIEMGTMTCQEADNLFRRQSSLDHIIVQQNGIPLGLVTKHHFYTMAGGAFGFDLMKRRFVEEIAKVKPLRVNENVDITMLAHLAMEREHDDLYDPVIVEDSQGRLIGTVTMKELLTHSVRLELEIAAATNPLTGLAGNTMIETWLQDALENPPYSVIYADLDCFKEYNDSYGFPQGDQMIRLAAKTLGDLLTQIPGNAQLGHVGGDDFVIITKAIIDEPPLKALCAKFDLAKRPLFDMKDIERNAYFAINRQGICTETPLVTMSLAVVTSINTAPRIHPAQLGQIAALLKKKVKHLNAERGCSGYLIDRRRFEE